MKKTILLASFAIATLFAFSSCQKENLQDNGTTNGVRIITAEFENNATKTELNDGVTPEWAIGDKIRILNATDYQNVVLLSVSGEDTPNPVNPGDGIIKDGKIVIAIPEAMAGDLYAVYPASATSMERCNGEITFAIPAVQDGTFGSANICVAKGDDKDNLMFSNATAVLEFSQNSPSSTGVIRVAVDAENNIAGTLTAEFDENNKATVTATALTSKSIFTKAASSAKDKYYIAIAPGTTGAVGFKYYKALKEASDTKSSATLERNKIYALSIPDSDSGYENSYVEITADYDNDPSTPATKLKWAKVNIGATKQEDFGHYFAWGYTEGCVRNSANDGWVLASDNTTVKQFKTTDFSNRDDSSFKDAATANWGSNWRMPTANEFKALFANCVWYSTENEQDKKFSETSGAGYYVKAAQYDNDKGFAYMYSDGTNRKWEKWNTAGLKFDDTLEQPSGTYDISTTPLLFFLRAGAGAQYVFSGAGGYYWSKDSKDDNSAYVLNFGNTNLLVQGSAKATGLPIRPVSD